MSSNPTPVLTKRENDLGWLASTPDGYPFPIATVGETEAEAMASYDSMIRRWEALPDAQT